MAKKHTRRVSLFDAIALHAEANKSDPFAAKRMAMTLRNRNDKPKEVHTEATRIIAANAKRIERNRMADWVSVEQRLALSRKFAKPVHTGRKPVNVRELVAA